MAHRRDWSVVDDAILRVLRNTTKPLAKEMIVVRAGVPRLHFDIRLQVLKHRGLIEIAYGRNKGAHWRARLTGYGGSGSIAVTMDDRLSPIWFHDPTDESRYAVATNGLCPVDGSELKAPITPSGIDTMHCVKCRRVFYSDGKRVPRCWWSGNDGPPDPSKEELRFLLVTVLRSAHPHPVEHPTMWDAWGLVCRRIGLNPDDFRVPTSDPDREQSNVAG